MVPFTPDNLPAGVPPEALPHLLTVGYFSPDPLGPGDSAPDLSLHNAAGEAVRLRSLHAARPLVLVFGSFT